MIRKILLFPLRVVRVILLGVGVIVFIVIGVLDYFIDVKGQLNLVKYSASIDPIRYSKGGKVVDLDEYKEKAE